MAVVDEMRLTLNARRPLASFVGWNPASSSELVFQGRYNSTLGEGGTLAFMYHAPHQSLGG